MSPEPDPPSSTVCELANRYEELRSSPVNTPTQIDEPASMTRDEWDRRTERLAAAMQAARDAQPKACPSCGAPDVFPLFDPLDGYECVACCVSFTYPPAIEAAP